MEQALITLAVFGLAFVGLAVGVLFRAEPRPLGSSCGGAANNPECCKNCPDKPQCDDAGHASSDALSSELAHVAGPRSEDHPALRQHP